MPVVALFLIFLVGAVAIEAWGFMLLVGMMHIHILEAVNPISYGVALTFVLVSLPFQALGLAGSANNK